MIDVMHALLAVRAFLAALKLGNTKGIDILVYDPRNRARYEVEVKTNLETRTRDSKLFRRCVTG